MPSRPLMKGDLVSAKYPASGNWYVPPPPIPCRRISPFALGPWRSIGQGRVYTGCPAHHALANAASVLVSCNQATGAAIRPPGSLQRLPPSVRSPSHLVAELSRGQDKDGCLVVLVVRVLRVCGRWWRRWWWWGWHGWLAAWPQQPARSPQPHCHLASVPTDRRVSSCRYDATVDSVSMDRSTVTVNWDDGDEKNREIENKDENITR